MEELCTHLGRVVGLGLQNNTRLLLIKAMHYMGMASMSGTFKAEYNIVMVACGLVWFLHHSLSIVAILICRVNDLCIYTSMCVSMWVCFVYVCCVMSLVSCVSCFSVCVEQFVCVFARLHVGVHSVFSCLSGGTSA